MHQLDQRSIQTQQLHLGPAWTVGAFAEQRVHFCGLHLHLRGSRLLRQLPHGGFRHFYPREKSLPDTWDSSHSCALTAPFAPPSSLACAPACLALAARLHRSGSTLAGLLLCFLPLLQRCSSLVLPPTRLASVRSVYRLPPRFPASWPAGVPLARFASPAALLA